jgi:predicted transcriptional regulator
MYTYIAMERTQIYLSMRETEALDRVARETGHTRSHLIREAIRDKYGVAARSREEFLDVLHRAAGAWANETPEEAAERDRWLRELRGPGLGIKVARMLGEPPQEPDEQS